MTSTHSTNGHSGKSGNALAAGFPRKVTVTRVVGSRYFNGARPDSWDQRKEGVDIVATEEGETLRLWCDGGQSTPKKGWVLMLTGGDGQTGFHWTLYGYTAGAEI